MLTRISRGVYSLSTAAVDVKKLATRLYAPSYISLQTALSIYGIINQGTYILTLVTTRKPKETTISGITVIYRHIAPALFFGYKVKKGVSIADPEKAVLDTLYFKIYGKLHVSIDEWYVEDINWRKLNKYLKQFPADFRRKVAPVLEKLRLIERRY